MDGHLRMERSIKPLGSSVDHPLYTLVALPIEMLVYIISFTSVRDKVKLRYVSRHDYEQQWKRRRCGGILAGHILIFVKEGPSGAR